MMKKLIKKMMLVMLAGAFFCTAPMTAEAAQTEDTESTESTESTEETEREKTELTFEIAYYTYEILPEVTQEDLPPGFTLGDWEYHGKAVQAGFTENSDMVCVMAQDWETGYLYRFIYDPNHEMFVPYFGAEIKNGYIYTIPMYEGAEVPYGFEEAYFLIQTVPMYTYKRIDAELTQEEIALGVLSDDNYLVFLMMDENGREVHYTYDLIDRTYQRALLQKKDAETVTELNEVIDELHLEIGILNAENSARMNARLTVIGVLIAVVVIMAGVIVNLWLKLSRLQKGEGSKLTAEDDAEDFSEEEAWDEADDEELLEEESEDEDEDEEPEIIDLDEIDL